MQWAEAQSMGLRIFLPVGKRSSMDRHVDPFNKAFTAWLKPWSEVVDFGLHPTYALGSWESPRRWEVLADEIKRFEELVNQLKPEKPVYCIRKNSIKSAVKFFLNKFPGKVLYAVKTNPDPVP